MTHIIITTNYITLGQMLKFQSIVTCGADVKSFLLNNQILVNHIEDKRRGRKLYVGDVIDINNNIYLISEAK